MRSGETPPRPVPPPKSSIRRAATTARAHGTAPHRTLLCSAAAAAAARDFSGVLKADGPGPGASAGLEDVFFNDAISPAG